MTVYDLIALAVLAVSAALGYVRGGAREVVTVIAFILAIVVAMLALRVSGPIAHHAIHTRFLANAAAILVVFAIVYAILRLIGWRLIIRRIPGADASRTDRLLGIIFGLVRGVVALGVLFLLFTVATPPERTPHWVTRAAFYPLSRTAGHVLIALAPEGSAVAQKVVGGGKGYDAASRKSVDDLVEKTR